MSSNKTKQEYIDSVVDELHNTLWDAKHFWDATAASIDEVPELQAIASDWEEAHENGGTPDPDSELNIEYYEEVWYPQQRRILWSIYEALGQKLFS